MDETPVRIALTGRQDLDGRAETTRQSFPGVLARTPKGWTLSWHEPPESGLGDTRTKLTLAPGQACLSRRGELYAFLLFRRGERLDAQYETPFGRLPMEIFTRALSWDLKDAGGRVSLDYDLIPAGQAPIHAVLTLDLTPA